ncbi:MAG: hypothetical protein N3D71_07990, partial [Burkholderiaceae bacterium]|nr:hypothetical protein [Burkholderiaceae bacterium]
MDLAFKDIRRHLGKFVATIAGVAMLLAIVLVMNGIYQGNIADGVWLIENTATDLWVVERGRGGPFNEPSRLPADAAAAIARALRGGARWGRFDVTIAGRPRILRVVAAMMNVRSRLTGIATGDQGIFAERAAFEAVGGFAPI